MGDAKIPSQLLGHQGDPHRPQFEIHRDGQPIEISSEIPKGPDGKPLVISPEQLSFYEPPQETREDSLKKAQEILAEAKNNSHLKSRLELLQSLHLLNLAENFLTHLQKQELNQKSCSTEIELQRNQALQLIQEINEKLPELLFNQLDSLLHPEGYPINEKYFTQSVNQIFELFYGKLPHGKVYFTPQEIKKIFYSKRSHGMVERSALFQELDLSAREKQNLVAHGRVSLPKIQAWLSEVEVEGFRGSMEFEAELLSAMQKTLQEEGKSTKDAQYLLSVSSQIRDLLKQGNFEQARDKYLRHYAPGRSFFIDRYGRYENGKKLKILAIHLAIIVASGGLGGLVGAKVRGLLEVAKLGTSHAILGGTLLGFGPGFVLARRSFSKLLLNERFFDPKKSGIQNGIELVVESLLMGGLQLYLNWFLVASRLRTLLPTMAQRGLPSELLEGGALKPLDLGFREVLTTKFAEEIAAMPRLQRYLFKGSEFFQEVGAFIPFQIAESQVKLFAQGNLPSSKNLEAIDQTLKIENQIEQALFLLALKIGNRAVEPHLEPAKIWVKNKVAEWKEKGFFASPPSTQATAMTMGILSFIFPELVSPETLSAAGAIMGTTVVTEGTKKNEPKVPPNLPDPQVGKLPARPQIDLSKIPWTKQVQSYLDTLMQKYTDIKVWAKNSKSAQEYLVKIQNKLNGPTHTQLVRGLKEHLQRISPEQKPEINRLLPHFERRNGDRIPRGNLEILIAIASMAQAEAAPKPVQTPPLSFNQSSIEWFKACAESRLEKVEGDLAVIEMMLKETRGEQNLNNLIELGELLEASSPYRSIDTSLSDWNLVKILLAEQHPLLKGKNDWAERIEGTLKRYNQLLEEIKNAKNEIPTPKPAAPPTPESDPSASAEKATEVIVDEAEAANLSRPSDPTPTKKNLP